MSFRTYCDESSKVLLASAEHLTDERVEAAIAAIIKALKAGRSLLVCGNGGSAADAMHITAELVGRFLKERKALRAICLSSNPAVLTAWANDHSYETVFARQVEAYGGPGDVLLGLSTSGTSPNVLSAFDAARRLGLTTIALTGQGGAKLAAKSDILLDVPSRATPLIQQVHICLYHYMCERIEAACMAD